MDSILTAVLLGIIEGLTEFLPVSSTGHLIVAGHLMDFTGAKAATFEVVIQLGAILAVVVLYWDKFLGLLKTDPDHAFSGFRGLWMLFLTSLPASIVGLLLHGYIKQYLFGPLTVAWALAFGSIAIFYVEGRRFTQTPKIGLDQMTPRLAFGIGCFQCLALWPGFSRSAATILGGMILGAHRKLAAEYSFIAAVPIMIAATGYDLLKSYSLFAAEDIPFMAVGVLVSFVSAWAAVKVFIGLVSRMTFRPFAVYRIIVAAAVILFLQ